MQCSGITIVMSLDDFPRNYSEFLNFGRAAAIDINFVISRRRSYYTYLSH